MKEKILALRAEGKNYNEIKEILGCSKSTISYHCGEGQKEKNNARNRKYKGLKPLEIKFINFNLRSLKSKTRDFQRNRKSNEKLESNFDFKKLADKIKDNPVCYLTGRKIDLTKSSTYHFDHIIPVSKGGDGRLSNLGLASREANVAKNDMSLEEFIELCKDVLIYNDIKL